MVTRGKRRLKPEARREQLLDVALALAAGGDVAAVSVEDLAAAAGVSEGLLYHYFPTKQALVEAAVRRAADEFLDTLYAARDVGGDPVEQLAAGFEAYLDHVEAQPVGWRAIFLARTGELAAVAADLERRSSALVADALGLDPPSAELTVALAGWNALEREVCLGWLDHPEVPRAAIEEILMASFLATVSAVAHHDPALAAALAPFLGPD